MNKPSSTPNSLTIEGVQHMLARQNYVADRALATSVFLALALEKPLLVEGPTGVGKTEIAKALAAALGTRLIRLQCYEGLDVHTALYEWNYAKQMLRIKMEEQSGLTAEEKERTIFSEDFLLERPLLAALREPDRAPVLLIDELDRADAEFDAFLLEVLSDFQITIPELGTIRARHKPYVIITSNRTREMTDAVRRRCLYQWIGYPSIEKEMAVIKARLPEVAEELARQVSLLMQQVRDLDLDKPPGTSESLDWARALLVFGGEAADGCRLEEALGLIGKTRDDVNTLRDAVTAGTIALGGGAHD